MKLRPLHDWALIRRIASAEITSGGIIIPEAAKEKPAEGIIEAIGAGRYKKEPGKKGRYISTVLKPGQRVYFTEYMAKDVEIDGKEFTFIREEDILGLVEETGAIVAKKEHPVTEKKDQPVMVQARLKSTPAAFSAEKTKKEPKKPAVAKKPSKPRKATPAGKTSKKAVSEPAAGKKSKSSKNKTAQKPAAKKAVAAKKKTSKTVGKKTAAKKPVNKTAAKTKKKSKK